MNVLIVDDDKLKRLTLTADLTEAGHQILAASSGEQALELLESKQMDVVVTDLKMPGMDGLELLRAIKEELSPGTEVIMMTAFGTIPLAVEAIRLGALDFVTKPFDNRQLLPLLTGIEQRMARQVPPQEPVTRGRFAVIEREIIGTSPPVKHLKHLARLCAESDSHVLLCGETGTGKDLTASVIHRASGRNSHPLVKVSCAMFPEQLVESELFGHEKGAFTGADSRRGGRLELASHGTVYLDDVDDIPLKEQVKLLRVIEEKVYERVGSTEQQKCDVRFIASTKAALPELIARGEFREDLYYRLKVVELHIPPLRERLEDIPLLADGLLERFAGKEYSPVPAEIITKLQSYDWPGNVRELAHALEQAWILGKGRLLSEHFHFSGNSLSGAGLKGAVNRTEQEIIRRALESHYGNKTAAARSVGIKPSTFRDKLRKHGLE
jgi:two-component system, NtrC family, response regulator AtoC